MSSRLEQLLKKQQELKAQIRKEKNKLSQAERKKDTRRKILLGSLMIDLIKKGELDETKIMTHLDGFLTRDTDRQLFDLTLIKKQQKSKRETKNLKNYLVQVILEEYPVSQKIPVLKIVRQATGLDLKETKKLIEALPASVIKIDSKQAEQIQNNLIEAGAKVSLKK